MTDISIVIKHIAIYSNNPIHDAIAKIIDVAEVLDASTEPEYLHLLELQAATSLLLAFTLKAKYKILNRIDTDNFGQPENLCPECGGEIELDRGVWICLGTVDDRCNWQHLHGATYIDE